MKRKRPLFYLNAFWESAIFLTVIGLLVYLLVIKNQSLLQNLGIFSFVLLVIMFSIAIFVYAIIIFSGINSFDQKNLVFKEGLLYSAFSFNPLWMITLISKKVKVNRRRIIHEKWNIFDLSLISLSVATFILLALIDNFLLPAIPPFFVSLPLHYLPLFFLCYVTNSFTKTFVAGLIGGLVLIVLPGTYFINFGQFIFDYLIPSLAFSMGSFVSFNPQKEAKRSEALKWIIFIALPMVVVFCSQVIAGVIFYHAAAWNGVSPWLFSIVVNGLNVGFEFLFLLIFVPTNLSRLWPLRNKYLVKNKG